MPCLQNIFTQVMNVKICQNDMPSSSACPTHSVTVDMSRATSPGEVLSMCMNSKYAVKPSILLAFFLFRIALVTYVA